MDVDEDRCPWMVGLKFGVEKVGDQLTFPRTWPYLVEFGYGIINSDVMFVLIAGWTASSIDIHTSLDNLWTPYGDNG
jgi:hypothetical protein